MRATERQRINEQSAASEDFAICPRCKGFGFTIGFHNDNHRGVTNIEIKCDYCHAKGIVKIIVFEIPTDL